MNLDTPIGFEQFYKENYGKFYYFALHLVENEEVSRDIVSDAFEFAWRNQRKSDVLNWRTFMYTCIRNKCVDYLRHEAIKDKYAELHLQVASEMDVSDADDYDERIDLIRKLLAKLPPQTRLVLQESYINRKKYKEIAEELDISPNTVKKHIVKALKKIREESQKFKTR